MKLPKKVEEAIEQFSNLSGIGEKTAMRHVLAMTDWSKERIQHFSLVMASLSDLDKCVECGMLCDTNICHICSAPLRSAGDIICVVENVADCLAIEKSGEFGGLYHILGGVLNPLIGIGPEELTIRKLLSRIREKDISEIILALNPSVEGDVTSCYIKEITPKHIKIGRIGLGVPMGGTLEYLDSLTINKALENRKFI